MENVIEIMNKKEKLVVKFGYEETPESPRYWDNIGTIYTWERSYISPDKSHYSSMEEFIESVLGDNSLERLRDRNTNVVSLFEDISKQFDKKGYILYPVSRYEHGMVKYYMGATEGWDTGTVGVIFAKKEKIYEEFGVKKISKKIRENVEKNFEGELEEYTDYANGDVYTITVEDFNGKELDSCSSIYGDLYSLETALELAQNFVAIKDEDLGDWELYDEYIVEELNQKSEDDNEKIEMENVIDVIDDDGIYKFSEKKKSSDEKEVLVAIGYFDENDIDEYLEDEEVTGNDLYDIENILKQYGVDKWTVSFDSDTYTSFSSEEKANKYINAFMERNIF